MSKRKSGFLVDEIKKHGMPNTVIILGLRKIRAIMLMLARTAEDDRVREELVALNMSLTEAIKKLMGKS